MNDIVIEHEFVDLGLPSGTLWAISNVGADRPEDFGDYFAWGETKPKDVYTFNNYRFAGISGTYNRILETEMLPSDDVANVNWGSGWRMTTKAQWVELCENTVGEFSIQNGVKGWLFKANNGNSLFLPAAGVKWGDQPDYSGHLGHYWSCSLDQ